MNKLGTLLLAIAIGACQSAPVPPTPVPPTPQPVVAPAPPPPPVPDFRASAPSPTAPRPFNFPDVERVTFDNGMRVLIARNTNAPLVAVRAVVRSGAAHDPANRAGLASLTANLVDEGAANRKAVQLTEALGRLGATIDTSADYDASFVDLDVLNTNLAEAFELFADVVRRPRLEQSDFNRIKKDRVTQLLQQRDQATAIATNRFASFVYRDTPYGRPVLGDTATVDRIMRGDIQTFYLSNWVPNNVSLIITGDVDLATARGLAQRYFADWRRGDPVKPVAVTAPAIERTQIYVVDRPAAVQSEIRVGHAGLPRSTEDYFPVLVMNTILGGPFTSRLNLNLREKHGYTYGARSQFFFRQQAGPFAAGAAVRNEVTTEAVRETLAELNRIRSGDIAGDELEFARNYLMGIFPASVNTASQLAQRITDMELYGLPEDYFENYRARIAATGKDDVTRVAQQYLSPDRAVVLVVGKASEVQTNLGSLGLPVTLYDIEGNPVGK